MNRSGLFGLQVQTTKSRAVILEMFVGTRSRQGLILDHCLLKSSNGGVWGVHSFLFANPQKTNPPCTGCPAQGALHRGHVSCVILSELSPSKIHSPKTNAIGSQWGDRNPGSVIYFPNGSLRPSSRSFVFIFFGGGLGKESKKRTPKQPTAHCMRREALETACARAVSVPLHGPPGRGVVDAKALAQKGVDRAQQSFELTQQRAVELKDSNLHRGAALESSRVPCGVRKFRNSKGSLDV